ncbi:MAG TPA: sigma-70 family RNA polymerase sigma factor [Tepidiformaceae bacterium]|nr:sigma-70 family RNA polymerase sigma factor [Tepidiformaceae bacterium]
MTRAVAQTVGPVAPEDGDDTLVAAAREDPQAFGHLYDSYYPRLFRYLRSRTTSPEDAADLTQQVFLRAFDNLHRYKPSGAFTAWLVRIARNAANDADRKRKRRGPAPVDIAAINVPDNGLPEDELLRRERIARLGASLATLDAGKRDLLALRFAAGLTSAEIGKLVGKSESAVKKQLSRTISSLKEHYRDDLT